jgi:hypothetical protein
MEERMRLKHFLSVFATVILIPSASLAEDGIESLAASGGDGLAWDQFDDPDFEPAPEAAESKSRTVVSEDPALDLVMSASTEGVPVSAPSEVRLTAGVILGPEGVDGDGRRGRLHTVARGDTLWDLSNAYLGTPWVWPSVWIDNEDIANPHLITPGNKIWITANEMRVVTDAEAESCLESQVAYREVSSEANFETTSGDGTFAGSPPLAALEGTGDDPSFPLAIPGPTPVAMDVSRQVTVSRLETVGFISAEDLAGASSIVESPSERTFLAEGDKVFLGMGEGDVEVGDQFTVFQVIVEVRDPETNRVLGSHVENLGWVEVKELTGDTSIGEIRQSYSEISRGAKVTARMPLSPRIAMRATPDAIEGQVVFLPTWRSLVADGSYVYLNRGEFHGVEVGSHMEVFVPGNTLNERERRVDVRTPDTAVAELVVVSVEEDSSVAFVLNADRELAVGDIVRPASAQLARR